MTHSYEKVNYLLRLRKQIERKCIIEALTYMSRILPIQKYHYFGFGSVYYADFVLFHKYLDIRQMTSVDNKLDDEKRFKFNKPYKFINFKAIDGMHYLETEFDWSVNVIFWLDFDEILDKSMLELITYVASKAGQKHILLTTIDAEVPPDTDNFLASFKQYLPYGFTEKDVKENFSRTLNRIVNTAINEGIKNNTSVSKNLQIFNLDYKDTSEMYTYGSIFCEEDFCIQVKKVLSDLYYISHDDEIISINCPLLTPKEKICLDKEVDKTGRIDFSDVEYMGLGESDVKSYSDYYKFYPQFFESIY